MPVCGAVLHLSEHADAREAVLVALAQLPEVTIGELVGSRLPVALSTTDGEADDALWRDLLAIPGVLHADVIFAAIDDAAAE